MSKNQRKLLKTELNSRNSVSSQKNNLQVNKRQINSRDSVNTRHKIVSEPRLGRKDEKNKTFYA